MVIEPEIVPGTEVVQFTKPVSKQEDPLTFLEKGEPGYLPLHNKDYTCNECGEKIKFGQSWLIQGRRFCKKDRDRLISHKEKEEYERRKRQIEDKNLVRYPKRNGYF